MGKFFGRVSFTNQLRDVYPPGFVATVYNEGLEAVFEFPGEITLPEHISCCLEKKRLKSRKIREVSPLAQLGIKRDHSESLLQDFVKLFPEKHQLMIGSYIVYFHQQRYKLMP